MSENEIINIINRPKVTRKIIAKAYREYMVAHPEQMDYTGINREILKKYTKSGLTYIKELAWGYKK